MVATLGPVRVSVKSGKYFWEWLSGLWSPLRPTGNLCFCSKASPGPFTLLCSLCFCPGWRLSYFTLYFSPATISASGKLKCLEFIPIFSSVNWPKVELIVNSICSIFILCAGIIESMHLWRWDYSYGSPLTYNGGKKPIRNWPEKFFPRPCTRKVDSQTVFRHDTATYVWRNWRT